MSNGVSHASVKMSTLCRRSTYQEIPSKTQRKACAKDTSRRKGDGRTTRNAGRQLGVTDSKDIVRMGKEP